MLPHLALVGPRGDLVRPVVGHLEVGGLLDPLANDFLIHGGPDDHRALVLAQLGAEQGDAVQVLFQVQAHVLANLGQSLLDGVLVLFEALGVCLLHDRGRPDGVHVYVDHPGSPGRDLLDVQGAALAEATNPIATTRDARPNTRMIHLHWFEIR